MFTKSATAFILTCEELLRQYPNSVFAWTFTLAKSYHYYEYAEKWRPFAADLYHLSNGTLRGVKVTEVHPGTAVNESHGLHWHALVNQNLPIHKVDALCRKHNMGNAWVHCHPRIHWRDKRIPKPVDIGYAHYLIKYMNKRTFKLAKGMRRWSTIGGFHATAMRDLQGHSAFHRNVQNIAAGQQMPFAFTTIIMRDSSIWGNFTPRGILIWQRRLAEARNHQMVKFTDFPKHWMEITPRNSIRRDENPF